MRDGWPFSVHHGIRDKGVHLPGQSCCSRAAPSPFPAAWDPAAIFTPRQFSSDRDPLTAVVPPPRFLALPAIESPRFGRIVSTGKRSSPRKSASRAVLRQAGTEGQGEDH